VQGFSYVRPLTRAIIKIYPSCKTKKHVIQPTWAVSSNTIYIVIHPSYGSASEDIPEAENLRNKKLYSTFRKKGKNDGSKYCM